MKYTGFVLIELVVVFGMLAVLIGMTTINISQSRKRASLSATIDTLVADMKSQQTKAMTGSTVAGGVLPVAYGIHFEESEYSLFHGSSYSASVTSNARVPLDTRVRFTSILFDNGNMIFASKSGELVGYVSGSSAVSVHQLDSGETKTIQLNQYGTITSIQ
jgi:type II secretory pathway pseudopilin PulG